MDTTHAKPLAAYAERCVYGKLVVADNGEVLPGSEHALTSRSTNMPEDIAAFCRPDRLLAAGVNPLRAIEEPAQARGALLLLPVFRPHLDRSTADVWMLAARIRPSTENGYTGQGQSKGGRPATIINAWAMRAGDWAPVAPWIIKSSVVKSAARPDTVGEIDSPTKRNTRKPLELAYMPVLDQQLKNVPNETWLMLDRLSKHEPMHFTTATFKTEAEFLEALAFLYMLLPRRDASLRCLPMVACGLAGTAGRFALTYSPSPSTPPMATEARLPPLLPQLPKNLSMSELIEDIVTDGEHFNSQVKLERQSATTLGNWQDEWQRKALSFAAERAFKQLEQSGQRVSRLKNMTAGAARNDGPRTGPRGAVAPDSKWSGAGAVAAAPQLTLPQQINLDHGLVLHEVLRSKGAEARPTVRREDVIAALDALMKSNEGDRGEDWQAGLAALSRKTSPEVAERIDDLRVALAGSDLFYDRMKSQPDCGLRRVAAVSENKDHIAHHYLQDVQTEVDVIVTSLIFFVDTLPTEARFLSERELTELFRPDHPLKSSIVQRAGAPDSELHKTLARSLCLYFVAAQQSPQLAVSPQIRDLLEAHYPAIGPRLDTPLVADALGALIDRFAWSNPTVPPVLIASAIQFLKQKLRDGGDRSTVVAALDRLASDVINARRAGPQRAGGDLLDSIARGLTSLRSGSA